MVIYKFLNWFREFGWRHLIGLIFAIISLYPIFNIILSKSVFLGLGIRSNKHLLFSGSIILDIFDPSNKNLQ